MEGELIFMAFVMLIGQIIMLQMWNANWFKRENFKMQKSNVMAQNKLNLRKMEKELGLVKTAEIIPVEKATTMDTLKNLAPLLGKLNPDTIDMLADKFLGGADAIVAEGGSKGGVTDMLMDFATKNPEMVQNLLEGVSGGLKDGGKGIETEGFTSQV